jgi:Rod binding domain-containing protein
MAALEPLAPHATASASDSAAAAAPSPRLVKAAHEFEAQMMKELLAPMTGADSESDPLAGDGDDSGASDGSSGLALGSGAGSGGALAEFASEALGQALSQRGGFGIADSIIHELSPATGRQEAKKVTTKVTHSLRGNTVMRKVQ